MKNIITLSLLSLLLLLLVTSCATDSWDGYFRIKYEVTGTATQVDISMLDESGNLLNFNGSSLPWEKEFKAYCALSIAF